MSQLRLKYLITTFFLFTIALSESKAQGSQEQSISFYKERNCLSNSSLGTVYETTNLTESLGSALSFSINGIWRMDYCGPYVPGGCKTNIWKYEDVCNTRGLNVNYNFTYVERYGNGFQNGTELLLFPQTDFKGQSYLSDGYGLDLKTSQVIMSWFFTGDHEWMLFSGAGFTGVKTCLTPNDLSSKRGYGFTYNRSDSRIIGSVLFTCDGRGEVSSTTVGLSTSTSDGISGSSDNIFYKDLSVFFVGLALLLFTW